MQERHIGIQELRRNLSRCIDEVRRGLTDDLAARAGDIAWKHGLRGYDAAQLAAALAWREATEGAEDEIVFACFDNHLRRAARTEGLETWPE